MFAYDDDDILFKSKVTADRIILKKNLKFASFTKISQIFVCTIKNIYAPKIKILTNVKLRNDRNFLTIMML